jgi:thiamine pyrophosphokinase
MSRIVVFANGKLNHSQVLKDHLRSTDRIFCANGGTIHALALGLEPEVVVGDLDSLSLEAVNSLKATGTTIHRHPIAKDQTDLELALDRALEQNPTEILLVSALGGRLDQMLANIFLLSRKSYRGIQMTLLDGYQWAALVRAGETLTISGRKGDTVSLIPLSPTVSDVVFTGVEWPLEKTELEFGSTWSVSNKMTGTRAEVSISTGLVLVVHIDQRSDDID